jgi:hypothetical protein
LDEASKGVRFSPTAVTRTRRLLLTLLAVSVLAAPAVAHVPDFATGNTSPATAHEVDPPTKSWAIYDSLERGQVRYYELQLEAGERLELALFTPDGGPFEPSMAVMSPAIEGSAEVPDRVTVPDGYGVEVVDGEKADQPTFEANAPAANYDVAEYERPVETDGRYLVAVYEPDERAGNVGVVAGDRESFTVVQYVTVAWDLPRIYLWGGDHPLVVFGPSLLVMVGGLLAVRRRLATVDDPGDRYALAGAGLLCVGTAANVLLQTLLVLLETGPTVAAVVPLVFVLLPATLGGAVVVRAVDPEFSLERRDRAFLAVAALFTLGTWAGFVVAPAALLAGAAAPRTWFR